MLFARVVRFSTILSKMVNGEGTKISSISALDKRDILAELFEFMFVEQKNLKNSYADFEIVDLE